MLNLPNGSTVPLTDGGTAIVLEEIGSGGQGVVYKVSIDGKPYALKWYYAHKLSMPAQFKTNLEENIHVGSPSKDFLWPLRLSKQHGDSFGYIMNLRPKTYADFSDILNNRKRFSSLFTLVESAIHIVNAFRELHRKGYSYQDINDGNFFINVDSGDVLICDNDNVAPYGKSLGIAGKPGYMAPEIVRGEVKPSQETDAHSLAVVLFKLFLRHDPLMGKIHVAKVCVTEKAEKELYGEHPVFIFDPTDTSNRPVPGVHPNPLKLWPQYPKYMQDMFIRAFAEGMKNRNVRPTDNEWRDMLIRLRGEILSCTCGTEMLACSLKSKVSNGQFACPKCHAKHTFPFVLESGKHCLYLFPGNKIYGCHVDRDSDDCETEVGIVTRNKNNPNMYGIRNKSEFMWVCDYGGNLKNIQKEEVAPIADNMKISFGLTTQAVVHSDN